MKDKEVSIDWNFGEQKPMEKNSTFTKDADAAFDEFCRRFLNSSNGFFMNVDQKSEALKNEQMKLAESHRPYNSLNKTDINQLKKEIQWQKSILNKSLLNQTLSRQTARNEIQILDSKKENHHQIMNHNKTNLTNNTNSSVNNNNNSTNNINNNNDVKIFSNSKLISNSTTKNEMVQTRPYVYKKTNEYSTNGFKASRLSFNPNTVLNSLNHNSISNINNGSESSNTKLIDQLLSIKDNDNRFVKSNVHFSNNNTIGYKNDIGEHRNFLTNGRRVRNSENFEILKNHTENNRVYKEMSLNERRASINFNTYLNNIRQQENKKNMDLKNQRKSLLLTEQKLFMNPYKGSDSNDTNKTNSFNNNNNNSNNNLSNSYLSTIKNINNINVNNNNNNTNITTVSTTVNGSNGVKTNNSSSNSSNNNSSSSNSRNNSNNSSYYFYDNTSDIFLDSKKSSVFSDDNEQSSFSIEIPKKNKFSDEFYSKAKLSSNQLRKNQDSYSYLSNLNKENDFNSYSNIADITPYIVNPTTQTQTRKPDGWLGFKVVACGMSKKGKLPIPKANFFIEKGDFGDDAGFWSENTEGDAIGIADGATGNCMFGYDPGDFSRNLMKICSEIFINDNKVHDAKSLLLKAYDNVQDKTCYGSCTACVLTLDHSSNMMTVANVGDSGYCLFRNGKIIHQSVPQRITFECPRQLDSYPWKEKSRRMGISYTDIIGKDTELEMIEVMKDDMVIISSDGLFDNLDAFEIEEICQKSKSVMDAAENLVYRSVKYYRKPDDILVIIGKVVDNKVSTIQQRYSKDPSLT